MKISESPPSQRSSLTQCAPSLGNPTENTVHIHLREEPCRKGFSPMVLRFSIDINSFSLGFFGSIGVMRDDDMLSSNVIDLLCVFMR